VRWRKHVERSIEGCVRVDTKIEKTRRVTEPKGSGLVVRLSISDLRTQLRTMRSADLEDTYGTRDGMLRDGGPALQYESWLGRPGDPADISRIHLADNPDTGLCDLY